MIRISIIFIAICMVLIAGSLGLVVHSVVGLGLLESGSVALAALIFLILYNVVSARMQNRPDVSGQITGLSHGTADLARQVTEFGRRIVALEHRLFALDSRSHERVQTAFDEIGELGALVKHLAMSIAAHDELLNATQPRATPLLTAAVLASDASSDMIPAAIQTLAPEQARSPQNNKAPSDIKQTLAAVQKAIETNRIDIFLQPLVTLPQRKVRFYEAVSRLRDDNDEMVVASNFIAAAEAGGLMSQIDHIVLLRCVQVLRRLIARNKDVGMFCNVSAATLGNAEAFAPYLDFLEANRALAPSLVLEFKQATLRSLGPTESEHLAALAQRGYRFSVDHVSDLRLEPRDLADRGVRFIKVPAHLLLDQNQPSTSDIHPADLSDLLGRFGIDLVVERIEGERAVLDLLDYDVRFGQGFLFAPPRPVRPESVPATLNDAANSESQPPAKPHSTIIQAAKIEASRMTGKAALVSRSRSSHNDAAKL